MVYTCARGRKRRGKSTAPTPLWGRYGFKDAFNVDKNWRDEDYIGIDQGVIILMIENYRSGLVWREFMAIPYIQQALTTAGFVPARSS
jgi:hypothetical protein